MSGRSPDSPGDPKREFEEQWGKRGTRGIRGGASAKRKRDAWTRYQSEQTGLPPEQIPVVHAGGLSRPLYTPTSWEPVNQLSDSDVEIVAEQVVIHDTDLEGVFPLSAPVSREAGSLLCKKFWGVFVDLECILLLHIWHFSGTLVICLNMFVAAVYRTIPSNEEIYLRIHY